MAIKWRVDEGLAVLIAQWKQEHPGAVVYTIGDADHASRSSEHNPEPDGSEPGADYGEVDAADFMIGHGVTHADLQELRDQLVAHRDARLWYVIWDGKITSSTTKPWTERDYSGKDQHTDHAHVSVNDKFDKNITPWKLEDPTMALKNHKALDVDDLQISELKYGNDDDDFAGYDGVLRAQALLGVLTGDEVETDGIFGPQVRNALKKQMAKAGVPNHPGTTIGVAEWKILVGMWQR